MAWIPASSPTPSAEPRTQRGKHQEKSRFGSSTVWGSLGFPALKQQQNILEFPLIPHFVPATPCIPLASFDFTF